MAFDCYQMLIGANLAGQPCENVIHFVTDDSDNPNPQIVNNNVYDMWVADFETPWLDCLPDNYSLIGYKIKRVNNGGGPALVKVSNPPGAGTRGANADESAVGPVIISSFNNGEHWRTGKIFLPGVATGDIVLNVFQAALVTAIDALITELEGTHVQGGITFSFAIYAQHTVGVVEKRGHVPAVVSLSAKPGVQGGRLKPVF
jgi:hypothetical protein